MNVSYFLVAKSKARTTFTIKIILHLIFLRRASFIDDIRLATCVYECRIRTTPSATNFASWQRSFFFPNYLIFFRHIYTWTVILFEVFQVYLMTNVGSIGSFLFGMISKQSLVNWTCKSLVGNSLGLGISNLIISSSSSANIITSI